MFHWFVIPVPELGGVHSAQGSWDLSHKNNPERWHHCGWRRKHWQWVVTSTTIILDSERVQTSCCFFFAEDLGPWEKFFNTKNNKKGKKMRKEPGEYGEEEGRRMELGEEENQRKDSAQKRAMKSSFIHTVSSNYQCIYSIPSGIPIVFKNNRGHT